MGNGNWINETSRRRMSSRPVRRHFGPRAWVRHAGRRKAGGGRGGAVVEPEGESGPSPVPPRRGITWERRWLFALRRGADAAAHRVRRVRIAVSVVWHCSTTQLQGNARVSETQTKIDRKRKRQERRRSAKVGGESKEHFPLTLEAERAKLRKTTWSGRRRSEWRPKDRRRCPGSDLGVVSEPSASEPSTSEPSARRRRRRRRQTVRGDAGLSASQEATIAMNCRISVQFGSLEIVMNARRPCEWHPLRGGRPEAPESEGKLRRRGAKRVRWKWNRSIGARHVRMRTLPGEQLWST